MKIFHALGGIAVVALIFLALVVPTSYIAFKAALLVVALCSLIFTTSHYQVAWSTGTLLSMALLALFGLINSLHGVINVNPGAVRVLSVLTLWPILYSILSVYLNRPHAFRVATLTLTLAYVSILIYSYMFLGYEAGIVPESLYFELDQGQAVAFYDGRVRFNLFSIASLLFLMPFWIHYVWILKSRNQTCAFHWFVMVAGLVLCMLTGRIGLQLVVLAIPLLVALTSYIFEGNDISAVNVTVSKSWRNIFLFLLAISISGFVLLIMDVEIDAVVDRIVGGFDFGDASNPDASERGNQYISLIQKWQDQSVLFGVGSGGHTDYLRSEDAPWEYELTYIYLLFSTGIFGVMFYSVWFVWGVGRSRNALRLRRDLVIYVAPLTTGVFGLALGAASNPYFSKFDYLWILFLPHLLAGAVKHQKSVK